MKTKVLSEQSELCLEEIDTTLRMILAGVFLNATIQNGDKLNMTVIDEAIKEINKLLTKHTEEVIKDLLPEEIKHYDGLGNFEILINKGHNSCRQQIKDKAKERYNITIK